MDIYHQILKEYWGYDEFRSLQEDIIHSVAAGKDTLGLMPTGGGKSLTFQVPTMAMDGLCIVVTPLIALMKDQVDNLRNRGIKALAVYSGMTRQEIITALENAILGDFKFLYVSPERLGTELFIRKLQEMNVCLLVIDESHCVSQWGYDFRPSYLKIADIRKYIPDVPALALTATATPEVVYDIQNQLHFKEKNVFQKSFSRKNISYIVRNTEDKEASLLHILERIQGTAIVYVRSRQKTKEIADFLVKNDLSADYYHAGLTASDKWMKQNAWKKNECRIIVCTNAFGMGIDKPDVRLVVHMDLPNSLEEYFQEAGRAGRDEHRAYAVILYHKTDGTKLKKRISDEFPQRPFISNIYDQLAYFLQVAEGYGMETIYDFDIRQFCASFKTPVLPTHNALKIIDLSGYIEYIDEVDNNSRLMFTVYRDALYHYDFERDYEQLVNIILRLYTGLFADYVTIDEKNIAVRLGKTRKEVYDMLKVLSKRNIIDYIPHKKTPLIAYKTPRIESKYLQIPRIVYEERKDRFEKRINSMLEYVNRTDICRSRMLLAYFDENDSKDCGFCDVCKAKNASGLTNKRFNDIAAEIKEHLNEKSLSAKSLINSITAYKENEITIVIRFLLDKGILKLDADQITYIEQTDNNIE